MKLPNRVRTYAFWVGLSSAIVILVQSIGKLFGLQVEGSIIENVIMSICGVLVVLGIVSKNEQTDLNATNTHSESGEVKENKEDIAPTEVSDTNIEE